MTNDTLNAHIRAYRSGTIMVSDLNDMVEELTRRYEDFDLSKAKLREHIEAAIGVWLPEDDKE